MIRGNGCNVLVKGDSSGLGLRTILMISSSAMLRRVSGVYPLRRRLRRVCLAGRLGRGSIRERRGLVATRIPRCCFGPTVVPTGSRSIKGGRRGLARRRGEFISILRSETARRLVPLLCKGVSRGVDALNTTKVQIPKSTNRAYNALRRCKVPSLIVTSNPTNVHLER